MNDFELPEYQNRYSTKITPTTLQSLNELQKPFEAYPQSIQEDVLYLEVNENINESLEKCSTIHIISEFEYMLTEESTPSDIHPNDSDNHTVLVDDWFNHYVNKKAFESIDCDDIVHAVKEKIKTELRNKTSDIWNDVIDDIGNPARATHTQIQNQIENRKVV